MGFAIIRGGAAITSSCRLNVAKNGSQTGMWRGSGVHVPSAPAGTDDLKLHIRQGSTATWPESASGHRANYRAPPSAAPRPIELIGFRP